MKKEIFKKGFTLIELMIVIVILGVLMGTILPRLTGAQARARDTGRVADMNTISQALETYYDDYGYYVGGATGSGITVGDIVCLSPNDTGTGANTITALEDYVDDFPFPPSASQETSSCIGGYVYIPLTSKGLDFNGYVLASDMETYQKANAIADADIEGDNAEDIRTTYLNEDLTELKTADDDDESTTIYMIIK
ncbi:prepilin-type N-terminal cleavage/methylation domain-containing protein [Candidatus Peregrinibacteria bacterium]|nr:prepilin-type N-terminal cleavage/methylation domain-containing protein [Candidatus Peregrinibacteria bacterium]